MAKLIRFIPLVLVLVLGVFLYRGLFLNPQELPSALVGKPLPTFNLTKLGKPQDRVTDEDIKGKVAVLNVWATWCPTCVYEHPFLLELAKSKRVALYGVNYKDDRAAAQAYLKQYKDPFIYSVFDDTGKLGLDLGVYGAPETFVIDSQGIVRKRFAGALDGNVWQREFEPLIQSLEKEALIARGN